MGIGKIPRKPCEKKNKEVRRTVISLIFLTSLGLKIYFIMKHNSGTEIPIHIIKETITDRDKHAQKSILVRTC